MNENVPGVAAYNQMDLTCPYCGTLEKSFLFPKDYLTFCKNCAAPFTLFEGVTFLQLESRIEKGSLLRIQTTTKSISFCTSYLRIDKDSFPKSFVLGRESPVLFSFLEELVLSQQKKGQVSVRLSGFGGLLKVYERADKCFYSLKTEGSSLCTSLPLGYKGSLVTFYQDVSPYFSGIVNLLDYCIQDMCLFS